MRRHTLTTALTIALAGYACAQDATPDDSDVLSGPSVTSDADEKPTIVRRAFDGTLERPEGLPEIAALDALGLEGEARQRVDDALTERNAMIDGILAEHLDLFARMIQAFQARGSGGVSARGQADSDVRREMAGLLREVRPVVAPVVERGTLRAEIAGALDEDQRAVFEGMLDEYDAAVRAGADGMESMGGRERRRGGGTRAGGMRDLMGVVREFGSSYERVIGQRAEDYNAMLESLDVSPETRAKIEAVFQGSLSEDYDNEEDRRRAQSERMRELLGSLGPEDRADLVRELRKTRGSRGGG
ncbi:MAG: hypothetical protein AAGH64_03725 [Planctomycetota bacterium]